jgi:hypothetical protein
LVNDKKEAIVVNIPLTANPFAQMPKESFSKRQQALQAYSVGHTGKAWRVCVRPVGPDDQPILHAGICFVADDWHTLGRYTFETQGEAVGKIRTLGGDSLQQVSGNEWVLHGIRYMVKKAVD